MAYNAGYFAKVLAAMPLPNNFIDDNGDGLVSGVYRYLLTRRTGDPTFYNETLVGNDPYSNRKQINIKIDQNFKSHRISAGWTHQMDDNVVFRGEWQDGFGGNSYRRPHIFAFNVTSTLSSTLVNEGRFGLNINKAGQDPPWLSRIKVSATRRRNIWERRHEARWHHSLPCDCTRGERVSGGGFSRGNHSCIRQRPDDDPLKFCDRRSELFERSALRSCRHAQLVTRETRAQVRRRLSFSTNGWLCVSALHRRAVR